MGGLCEKELSLAVSRCMKHQVRLAQLHLRAEGEACEPQVAELNSCLGERMRTTRREASCS